MSASVDSGVTEWSEIPRCVMRKSTIIRWSSPRVILVATNFLEGQTLLLNAIYQAKLSSARVLLVHVIPHRWLKADIQQCVPSFLPGPAVRAIKSKLDETAKEFSCAGVLCEPIILTGFPAEQIALLAKLRGADRVIVGTRYASGVARLVESSVAEELIATVDAPVCVIGRRAHPRQAYGVSLGNVLLATSLHSHHSLLVEFASALAELNESRLTLLHVLDTKGMSEQERELARLTVRQSLASLIPSQAGRNHQSVLLIREGDAATVILHEAGSLSQDVLILGSSNYPLTPRLLNNGIVHRVITESQLPVITVRTIAATGAEDTQSVARVESASVHS
jgi:nucleotide-binding universal stress UspA family protein